MAGKFIVPGRRLKSALKALLPPILVTAARRLRPEWAIAREGASAFRHSGWSEPIVTATHESRWRGFVDRAHAGGDLGFSFEDPALQSTVAHHNVVMTYGYAAARAASGKSTMSILDWGGGIGHYFILSRALLPDVAIRYSVVDLPGAIASAAALLPEATFATPAEHDWNRRYDLVLASGSLQCIEDWKPIARRLAASATTYFYLARVPVVKRAPSFVTRQKGSAYGYPTDFTGWCLNHEDLLRTVSSAGVRLEREFMLEEYPPVAGAPEQPVSMGFLFRAAP